jgi:hypothetical protein
VATPTSTAMFIDGRIYARALSMAEVAALAAGAP